MLFNVCSGGRGRSVGWGQGRRHAGGNTNFLPKALNQTNVSQPLKSKILSCNDCESR